MFRRNQAPDPEPRGVGAIRMDSVVAAAKAEREELIRRATQAGRNVTVICDCGKSYTRGDAHTCDQRFRKDRLAQQRAAEARKRIEKREAGGVRETCLGCDKEGPQGWLRAEKHVCERTPEQQADDKRRAAALILELRALGVEVPTSENT